MEAEGLPGHARALGARAMERLQALERRHPELRVRGLGLMIGIEVFGHDGQALSRALDVLEGSAGTELAAGAC